MCLPKPLTILFQIITNLTCCLVYVVVTQFKNLRKVCGSHAEEYIRRTPRQIDTECRRQIEAELNWTSLSDI
jgi:hypothetical protein